MMNTNNKKMKKYVTEGSASTGLPVASSGRSVSQGAARKTAREKIKRSAARGSKRNACGQTLQKVVPVYTL